VVLSPAEREQLAAVAADRNRPRKHVERARIVLASADQPGRCQTMTHDYKRHGTTTLFAAPFWSNSTAALYHPFEPVH
jgi:hypothetical protein